MPEGDTVWRAARQLDRALTGRVLEVADFRVPRLATRDLVGETVVGTRSVGKHLLTRIGEEVTLHTHLKMEGAWHVHPRGARWRRPGHEARVVLATEDTEAVGFALGVVALLSRSAEGDAVGHLGPDLLAPDWDAGESLRRLLADSSRPVHETLLDQRVVAGIGSIYASELCFVTGVHPGTPVGKVPRPERLLARARAMLQNGTRHPEQATTGDLRRGRRHWVYRRDRQACRRCGTPVAVEMRGPEGRERAAYWCPACQPGPGAH